MAKTKQDSNLIAINKHIAGRIKQMRGLRGMSQEQLGEAIGVTFQQVQKYEKGANRVASGALVLIADALDVPVSFFYDGISDRATASTPDPLADPDTLKLVRFWKAIPDPVIRSGVIELCRSCAK